MTEEEFNTQLKELFSKYCEGKDFTFAQITYACNNAITNIERSIRLTMTLEGGMK